MGEDCRGLFSPLLPFVMNSLVGAGKGSEGPQPEHGCQHPPTKRATWFTRALRCTEEGENEHLEAR